MLICWALVLDLDHNKLDVMYQDHIAVSFITNDGRGSGKSLIQCSLPPSDLYTTGDPVLQGAVKKWRGGGGAQFNEGP